MSIRSWMVTAGVVCAMAATASAEWERTVSAWDTQLPDQGKTQASLWASYTEYDTGPLDSDDWFATAYLTYGIQDNWSVALAPSFLDWSAGNVSESGFSDLGLLSTYRFQEETEAAAGMAVQGRISLPTGDEDKGLGSGHVEPGVALLGSMPVGAITLVGNVGGDLILDADKFEEDFVAYGSLEAIYDLNEQVSLNGVLSAATARLERGDEIVDVGVGSRIKPNEQLFVVGAVYACLTDAYDWSLQIAAGYEF